MHSTTRVPIIWFIQQSKATRLPSLVLAMATGLFCDFSKRRRGLWGIAVGTTWGVGDVSYAGEDRVEGAGVCVAGWKGLWNYFSATFALWQAVSPFFAAFFDILF